MQLWITSVVVLSIYAFFFVHKSLLFLSFFRLLKYTLSQLKVLFFRWSGRHIYLYHIYPLTYALKNLPNDQLTVIQLGISKQS